MDPILILLIGMAVVIGAIVLLRSNAFLALIGAAILVSLLAPGDPAVKITRVAEAFGSTAAGIGIVIALAAVIGKAMMDSGAADRIVHTFLSVLGEKRSGAAMVSSGLVLSIPVFFDTVFYLLVPLARSLYTRTNRNYLKYIMAIAAGGAAAHTLVPPTPGPLAIAEALDVQLGTMILMGLLVTIPAAAAGLVFSSWVDRRMPVEMRREAAGVPVPVRHEMREFPALLPSLLPIALPVLLISMNTVVASLAGEDGSGGLAALLPYTAILGNANLALFLSAAIAMGLYVSQRKPTRSDAAAMVESALMSGGVIILITAAGGAFGAMLQEAGIGSAIQQMFAGEGPGSGLVFLFLGFGVASLMKIAQGSSTVAMITTAAMIAAMIGGDGDLPFHAVYIAMAIASGSLVGSWMNDSGFWIFTKMGGLTEAESLKSWTPLLAVVGITSMVTTTALALLLPLN